MAEDFTTEWTRATKKPPMSTKDTLSAYSEWLDSQGIIRGPRLGDPRRAGDMRSHDDLAAEFIEDWECEPDGRGVLAGRVFARALEALGKMVEAAKS